MAAKRREARGPGPFDVDQTVRVRGHPVPLLLGVLSGEHLPGSGSLELSGGWGWG